MRKMLYMLIILFALILCCFCAMAEGSDSVIELEKHQSGDYWYIIKEDGTAEITDKPYGIRDCIIPAELDGYTVTSIGAHAFEETGEHHYLGSVTIPDSVTTIGDYAFYSCLYLKSVTIPDSVISIGNHVFEYCHELTVTIPDSVRDIGPESCRRVNISYQHPYLAVIDGVLFSKQDKRLICFLDAFSIENYAIPEGIKMIGEHAFDKCYTLKSIFIPGSVVSVGDSAFAGCSNLYYVSISDGVKSIGSYAFSGCDRLSSITIPDSIEYMGANPFVGAGLDPKEIQISPDHPYLLLTYGLLLSKPDSRLISALSNPCYTENGNSIMYIPEGVRIIGESAVSNRGVGFSKISMSVIIPDGVVSIEDNAFYRNNNVRDVTISASVTHIGDSAFEDCDIESVTILGDGAIDIGDSAFNSCTQLESLRLGNRIVSIGNSAFYYCIKLTSVILPEGATSIGNEAFATCTSLREITIPDSVTRIGENALAVYDSWRGGWIPNEKLNAIVSTNSYAGQYCRDNNISCTYTDGYDWLNSSTEGPAVTGPVNQQEEEPLPETANSEVEANYIEAENPAENSEIEAYNPEAETAIERPAEAEVLAEKENVPEFGVSSDELLSIIFDLFTSAQAWEEGTAPQTIEDFPLIPINLHHIPAATYTYDGSKYLVGFNSAFNVQYIQGDLRREYSDIYTLEPVSETNGFLWTSTSEEPLQNVTAVSFFAFYNLNNDSYVDYREEVYFDKPQSDDLRCAMEIYIPLNNESSSIQYQISVSNKEEDSMLIIIIVPNSNNTDLIALYYSLSSGKLLCFQNDVLYCR